MIISRGAARGGFGVMRAMTHVDGTPVRRFAWLFEVPSRSERTMRMESLIARIRLLILVVNSLLLVFLLDTSHMHMDAAWAIMAFSFAYGVPLVAFESYRRWRLFQMSMATTLLDSIGIAAFIGATGGSHSPFYPLYLLSAAAVAMRFELKQAVMTCLAYAFTYAVAYFVTWDGSADEMGNLLLQLAYMLFIAVGVGQLAREENARARQIDEVERLNAENARLLSRNVRAARIDKLTGLLNRGFLEKAALREVRHAKASDGYLSVLFLDLDHLKRVNDRLGHDAGDRVLRQAATALRQRLRPQDAIGRYGGDEFVVVLPNVTRETAYDRGEALLGAVEVVNAGLPEDLQIGLSIGVATFPFDAQDYHTLVKVADQSMYLAKNEGGNAIRTANDLRLYLEEMPRRA
jgi:diguanylate cyclase (GGDEF)-like protein